MTNPFTLQCTVLIPTDCKYIFIPLFLTWLLNMYLSLSINVSLARKKYKVKYPNMYAESNQENADKFNSIQRARQNTLESLPLVLTTMLTTGLVYPIASTFFGLVWVFGRFIYGWVWILLLILQLLLSLQKFILL